MKKIIYTRVDGGLSVINPSPNARLVLALTGISAPTILALHVNGFEVVPASTDARFVGVITSAAPEVGTALDAAGIAVVDDEPVAGLYKLRDPVTDAQVIAALRGLSYAVEWAESDLAFAVRIALQAGRVQWAEPIAFGRLERALRGLQFEVEWAESDQEFAERIARSDVPVTVTDEREGLPDMMLRRDALQHGVTFDETAFRVVDEAVIPADREFRGAWTETDGKVVHDMAKAREIHKQRLRLDREPLMLHLDAEYMKADEIGDGVKKAEIAQEKQWLRDITSLADQALDLEQLRAVKVEA
jgi:hypothetical protein